MEAIMFREQRLTWFKTLRERLGENGGRFFDFIAEVRIGSSPLRLMQHDTWEYIVSCLGDAGDNWVRNRDVGMFIESAGQRLANLTPGGVLLPKRELEEKFNALHAGVASYLRSLHIDEMVESVFCPINVRLVRGSPNPGAEGRPYAPTKIHMD